MIWAGIINKTTNPGKVLNISVSNIEKIMGISSSMSASALFIFEAITTTASETFTLPLWSSGTYNFDIDWNDTTSDSITAYNQSDITHTFSSSGTYIIKIDGICESWYFNNSGDKSKIYDISQWGNLKLGGEGRNFYGCNNLTITATDVLDTSNDIDMNAMFYNCSNLTTVPNMSDWDTSNVTTFNNTFRSATAFNQDISGWDTSSVTTMDYMFQNATAFNQDISGWDTSSVENMGYMFNNATTFSQNISGWDTSSVTSILSMFYGATAFNQDIGGWDTSSVENLNTVFLNATAFDGDISGWDTSSVTEMQSTFNGATSFNQDISSWDTSNVTTFHNMFNGATSFNQDISSWETSAAIYMSNVFNGATAFNQDISSWDITNVTTMIYMFNGVTLSTANYNALLIGWEGQAVQDNVTFDGGNSKYSSGAAATARQALIDDHTWIIDDGGQE